VESNHLHPLVAIVSLAARPPLPASYWLADSPPFLYSKPIYISAFFLLPFTSPHKWRWKVLQSIGILPQYYMTSHPEDFNFNSSGVHSPHSSIIEIKALSLYKFEGFIVLLLRQSSSVTHLNLKVSTDSILRSFRVILMTHEN
jgi:hypothetical protein